MKICFIAPSGYGKSTAIKILSERYPIKNIKIGEPLYTLQEKFYKFIGKEMKSEQDGELLQFLGAKIRKENPTFLLEEFSKKVKECGEDYIITNDDCRPPDYEHLKNEGFIFVEIVGFKHDRNDHTPVDNKNSLEWQNPIICDFKVENLKKIENFRENLFNLMKKLKMGE